MSVLTLSLALLACWEPEVVVGEPDPTPAPALGSGAYEIQILGIEALDCEGLSPRDVVGQSLSAELRVSGENVQLDFEGWQLAGTMADGELFVDGTAGWVEDVPTEDEDVDVDVEDRGDEASSSSSEEGEVGYEEEDPHTEPPSSEELYAAVSASVVSERLAYGTFSMEMPGCAMDLEAALLFVGPGHGDEPPVVVEPDEPPPHEEEPCGRESDCG